MPRQSLLIELFHERIRIKFFYIVYTRTLPFAFEEHHSTNHGWNSGSVAYTLRTGFFVCCFVTTIVVHVISYFFAIFQPFDTATDRRLSGVVFTQITRIRKNSFQELDRNDFLSVYSTSSIRAIPIFWITRKCVRYSCPKVIQKRARLIVG